MTGNVFRDLGDPDADLKQAKAILAARIVAALEDRGLSVRKAGARPAGRVASPRPHASQPFSRNSTTSAAQTSGSSS